MKKDRGGREKIVWGNWRNLTHVKGRLPEKSTSVKEISLQEIDKRSQILARSTARTMAKNFQKLLK